MKNAVLLSIFVCLLSCSSEADLPFQRNVSLEGKWMLLEVTEIGVDGVYTPNYESVDQFTSDGKLKRSYPKSPAYEPSYYSYSLDTSVIRIYVDKDYVQVFNYEIKDDQLFMKLIDIEPSYGFCGTGIVTSRLYKRMR